MFQTIGTSTTPILYNNVSEHDTYAIEKPTGSAQQLDLSIMSGIYNSILLDGCASFTTARQAQGRPQDRHEGQRHEPAERPARPHR